MVYLCLDWESRRQEKTLVSLSQTVCFRNTKGGWRIKDILSIHLQSRLEALKDYSKLSCLLRIVLIYYHAILEAGLLYSKLHNSTRRCLILLKAFLLNSKVSYSTQSYSNLLEGVLLNSKMSFSTRRCPNLNEDAIIYTKMSSCTHSCCLSLH